MFSELDWLDPVVYSNRGDVLAEKLFLAMPMHNRGASHEKHLLLLMVLVLLFLRKAICSCCCVRIPLDQAGLPRAHVSHGYDFDSHHLASGGIAMVTVSMLPAHLDAGHICCCVLSWVRRTT